MAIFELKWSATYSYTCSMSKKNGKLRRGNSIEGWQSGWKIWSLPVRVGLLVLILLNMEVVPNDAEHRAGISVLDT